MIKSTQYVVTSTGYVKRSTDYVINSTNNVMISADYVIRTDYAMKKQTIL